MPYVIVKTSSVDNSVKYYEKRLSTSVNGVKGSYPIYVDSADDAHLFDTLNRAQASLRKLEEFHGNQISSTVFSIVDFNELVDQEFDELLDKVETIMEENGIKIEIGEVEIEDEEVEDTETELHNGDSIYRISKDSVLSNIHPTTIDVIDRYGFTHQFSSVHQAYYYLIADYFDEDDIAFEITFAESVDEVTEIASEIKMNEIIDFDKLRSKFMLKLITQRYLQDEDFADELDETVGLKLVVLSKNNYWGDNYGKGQNMLGEILMKVRNMFN